MKLSFTNKPSFTNCKRHLSQRLQKGFPRVYVGISRVQHAYKIIASVIEAGKSIHACLAYFDLLKNWVMKKPNHSKAFKAIRS